MLTKTLPGTWPKHSASWTVVTEDCRQDWQKKAAWWTFDAAADLWEFFLESSYTFGVRKDLNGFCAHVRHPNQSSIAVMLSPADLNALRILLCYYWVLFWVG